MKYILAFILVLFLFEGCANGNATTDNVEAEHIDSSQLDVTLDTVSVDSF